MIWNKRFNNNNNLKNKKTSLSSECATTIIFKFDFKLVRNSNKIQCEQETDVP